MMWRKSNEFFTTAACKRLPPRGEYIRVVVESGRFFPMVTNGPSWEYFYKDPSNSYGYANLTHLSFSSKDEAIDFLAGIVLKAYNSEPDVVWP